MTPAESSRIRERAISAAAYALVHDAAIRARMTVREQAEAAYRPWAGPSLPELERRIRARRAAHPQRQLDAAA
jgi:hypothetical protein